MTYSACLRRRFWTVLLLLVVAGVGSNHLRSLAQDAPVDRCLTFSGNGQYVFVPHGPELNSFPFTIAFWLKTTQTNPFVGIATKYLTGAGNGWDVHLNNGYIRSYFFRSWSDRLWTDDTYLDRPNGGFVADGRWHHIAYTVDATGGRFYVDGEMTDHLPWTGAAGTPTHPMELILGGTRVDKTTEVDGHFVGTLDDLRIWNRALDGIGVRQLMAGAHTSQDPVLHFDFDQEAGPILTNRAATGARFQGKLRGYVPPVFEIVHVEERPTPRGRKQLVQRMFLPGVRGPSLGWLFAQHSRHNLPEAPEVTRFDVAGYDSYLFLDSEGQPLKILGNGTGRLVPGENDIPYRILRVFSDGTFIGLSWVTDSTYRIERFLPNGSPDSNYFPIETKESSSINVSHEGATWILDTESGTNDWQFFDRNGKSFGEAARPAPSYDLIGTDSAGRSYFGSTTQEGVTLSPMPLGDLFRCLPDGRLDSGYRPNLGPLGAHYCFGPLSSSGKMAVSILGDQQGSIEIYELSEEGDSLRPIASTTSDSFSGLVFLSSGELGVIRTRWDPWAAMTGKFWPLETWYESLPTGSLIPAPAFQPWTASEFAGPAWGTGIRNRDEWFTNPEYWPPSPALQTVTPPWYRELRTSPAPEAGFSDTGLFLPESALSVPVLRAGSTAAQSTVRGRLFPRTRNGWNEAEGLPFEATFPIGAAETMVNVSFLTREGDQPLREFLLRLESGTGIDIGPFRACRIWVLDDAQLPAPGELRLVTGVGRDEEGTAYLVGNPLLGAGPKQAASLGSTSWGDLEGPGAAFLGELLSHPGNSRIWVLPIPTTGEAGFFRP